MRIFNKRGQEEIVGFAIIVIIVSVIILFFLVFFLTSNKEVPESYEATSFLQSMLAYTSTCESGAEFLSVSDLIVACYNEERCGNSVDSCDVLNEELEALVSLAWPVGEDRPVKGYKIEAMDSSQNIIFSLSSGNATGVYKGSNQILPATEDRIRIGFTVYYSDTKTEA